MATSDSKVRWPFSKEAVQISGTMTGSSCNRIVLRARDRSSSPLANKGDLFAPPHAGTCL